MLPGQAGQAYSTRIKSSERKRVAIKYRDNIIQALALFGNNSDHVTVNNGTHRGKSKR